METKINGSVAARESTISTTNQQIMKDSHYIDRWTVPEILDGKPLAVYHAGCSRPGFRPDEESGMKANQKGEHSPYDFARRVASCGTESLRYQGHAALLFPRPVEYGNFSGRSALKTGRFIHAPGFFAMVQASSSTAMARTATKITARYGGLQSEGVSYKQTNHKQPGLRRGTLLSFPLLPCRN